MILEGLVPCWLRLPVIIWFKGSFEIKHWPCWPPLPLKPPPRSFLRCSATSTRSFLSSNNCKQDKKHESNSTNEGGREGIAFYDTSYSLAGIVLGAFALGTNDSETRYYIIGAKFLNETCINWSTLTIYIHIFFSISVSFIYLIVLQSFSILIQLNFQLFFSRLLYNKGNF